MINICCEKCKTVLIQLTLGKVRKNLKCYCASCTNNIQNELNQLKTKGDNNYLYPDFLKDIFDGKINPK